MLKKIFLKLIIILIIFLFPLISFAEESANVSLKCDKDNIKLGEKLELEINLDGKKTAAYQVNIFFDEEKFDFISEVDNNMSVKNGIIKIVWYDEKGGLNAANGNLKKLVFKAKKEGIGNFTINGEFYDENCNYILTNFNSVDIKVGDFPDENEHIKESTNLETLAIENEILYPAFDNNINDYDIEISNNVSNLNILAIPEDENASVLINGNENLTRDRVDSVQGNNVNNNRFINSRASDVSSQNNPNISGDLQAEDSVSPIEHAALQPNVSAPPIEPAVSQSNVSAPPIEPAVSQPNVSAPPIEPAMSQPNVPPIVNKNENLSENTNVSASSPFVETTPSGNPIIGGVPLNNSNISCIVLSDDDIS